MSNKAFFLVFPLLLLSCGDHKDEQNTVPKKTTKPSILDPKRLACADKKLTLLKAPTFDLSGPEDIAFDSNGFLYTGFENGKIYKFDPNTQEGTFVVSTGGRPLGIALNAAEDLIVADAHRGLLKIDHNTKEISVLSDSHNKLDFKLTDDLAIASDQKIYFTDASYKFEVSQSILEILEEGPHGRLLMYDPETEKTTLLQDKLYFPNGVALSPDESYILFNESTKYRVSRYWLEGEKKGQLEIFKEHLPGFPDNINYSYHRNLYWIAFAGKRSKFLEKTKAAMDLSKAVGKIPKNISKNLLKNLIPREKGWIIAMNDQGEIVKELKIGKCYQSTTSAMDTGEYLYIGSFFEKGLGRIQF